MRRAALLAAALAATACVSLSYVPHASIGVSPERIPLHIEVRDLADASPPDDRARGFAGTSATASDTLAGALPTALTNAILSNFRADSVFTEIRRRPASTDLVMSGTIRRFYARSSVHPTGWLALLTGPAYLGVPIFLSEAEVELEIRFERPDGAPVRTYSAARSYRHWSSFYHDPRLGIGTNLNSLLSESLDALRQQIVGDRAALLAAGR